MTSAIPACCSARARCGSIPTAGSPRMSSAAPASAARASHSAEVIGVAGIEKAFDDCLRDPANGGEPLQLSLDLTVQAAIARGA